MKPAASLFAILGFLVGLGVGYYSHNATPATSPRNTHAADLAAIEKLRQEDIAVTLVQDPKGLLDVWADDGVRFSLAGGPPAIGKQAIAAENAKFRIDYPDFKVLNYSPTIKSLEIAGDWAIEVGVANATFQLSAKDAPTTVNDAGVRLIKRQPDGSWKFALGGLK